MTNKEQPERSQYIFYILAILVLIIAGLLRYINLSTNPGWYSDEGTLAEIAKNLMYGRSQYLALNKSTLLAARLPLFPALMSLVFSITGVHITVMRYVTASMGVLTVGLLMVVIRNLMGKKGEYLALGAGFFLALYPKAILYSRLAFSYNLLAPLVVVIFWSIYKYLDTGNVKKLLLASILIGVGTISDIMMFTFLPAILMITIYKNWKDLYIPLFVSIFPFLLYSSVMYIGEPEAFIFDFRFTFFRLESVSLIAQYPIIALNYASLIFKDYWWVVAITGIFMLREKKFKYLVLILMIVPLFALGRTAFLPELGYYYLIPLFPLLAVGIAGFVINGLSEVFNALNYASEKYLARLIGLFRKIDLRWFLKPGIFILTSLLLFVIILSPIVVTGLIDFNQIINGIESDIDPVLVDTFAAEEAVKYVNARVRTNDLVLASPALAWAIDANAADFQMALAYKGDETKHLPSDIPQDRFSYAVDFKEATYIVIDPIWRNWAVWNMDGVHRMVEEVNTWPLVYEVGEIEVFKNPGN